ncbi:Gag-Pro-Pol polyprotein [Dictyocoela muelleri]|nr:Gag-Pro-Pol polyprotein [Dictyocoela muelleri]
MKIIGFIQWYRPYIKNLSTKLAPLTNILKKDKSVKTCGKLENECLESLLLDIKNSTLLNHPNPNKIFEIFTDASNIGGGGKVWATLLHENKTIEFFSYKFKKSELTIA